MQSYRLKVSILLPEHSLLYFKKTQTTDQAGHQTSSCRFPAVYSSICQEGRPNSCSRYASCWIYDWSSQLYTQLKELKLKWNVYMEICLCYCLFFFDHTIPQLVFITVAKIRNSLLKSSNVDTLDINHKVVSLYMYITVFEVNPVSFKLSI